MWLTRHEPHLRHWGRAFAVASLVHLTLPDFEQAGWGAPALVHLVGAAWLLWRPALGACLLCAVGAAWPLLFLRDVLTQSMYLGWCALVGAGGVAFAAPRRALDAVRWLTGGTYLLAALHKLNTEFLDPTWSCATHAWAQVADRWSLGTPPWLADTLPVATIVLEVVLGVAIVLRSPLMWPLGVVFHVPLTVTLAPAFGAVMLAGYVAATPARAMVRWRRALRCHGGWIAAGGLLAGALDIAFAGGVEDFYQLAKVLVAGALFAWSLLAWGPPWWRPPERALAPKLVALAWLLHGLTPYLGLQYQHTAAMLSNLRVDEGCHNSLVFPPALVGADPYVRVDQASFGGGGRPRRERVLRDTLWNLAALHTMHRNWCIPEQRPIRLAGTWRGRAFVIEDLCAPDWTAALPHDDALLPGFQRFQKNLLRACPTACVH